MHNTMISLSSRLLIRSVYIIIFVNYCVFGEDLDHNISVILRYFLFHFSCMWLAEQTELSEILSIVKSCSVQPPAAIRVKHSSD